MKLIKALAIAIGIFFAVGLLVFGMAFYLSTLAQYFSASVALMIYMGSIMIPSATIAVYYIMEGKDEV